MTHGKIWKNDKTREIKWAPLMHVLVVVVIVFKYCVNCTQNV